MICLEKGQNCKNTYSYNDHFRRFIVKKELEEKLEETRVQKIYMKKKIKGLSKTTVSDQF